MVGGNSRCSIKAVGRRRRGVQVYLCVDRKTDSGGNLFACVKRRKDGLMNQWMGFID